MAMAESHISNDDDGSPDIGLKSIRKARDLVSESTLLETRPVDTENILRRCDHLEDMATSRDAAD